MQIKIVQDQNPMNPRKEYEHLGTILYTSNHYLLGDEQVDSDRIKEVLEDEDLISLPVYAYIHGDVVLNTTGFSCPWDSGQCGVIYISKAKALKEWNRKRMSLKLYTQMLDFLKSEVEEFSNYLSGEVYGYQIVDDEGEVIDDCWGYYGHKWAEQAGQEALDAIKKAA